MSQNQRLVIRHYLESKIKPTFTLEFITPINTTKLKDRVKLDQNQQDVLLSTSFDTSIAFETFLERCGFKIINSVRKFNIIEAQTSNKLCSLVTQEPFNPKDFTMSIVLARYRDGSLVPMKTIDVPNILEDLSINTIQYVL